MIKLDICNFSGKAIEHIVSTLLVILFIGTIVHAMEKYMEYERKKNPKKYDGMGMARARFYDGAFVMIIMFVITSIILGFFIKWELKVIMTVLVFACYYIGMLMTLKPVNYAKLNYVRVS